VVWIAIRHQTLQLLWPFGNSVILLIGQSTDSATLNVI